MSTAISRIYTQQGFVIAADGRGTGRDGNLKDDHQKIFPIERPVLCLGCCLSGTADIFSLDGEIVFDLVPALKGEIKELDKCERFSHILDALAYNLASGVNTARLKHSHTVPAPDSNVFVSGYFQGEPNSGCITLHHEISTTYSFGIEDLRRRLSPVGSIAILKLLDAKDDRFAQYLSPCAREATTIETAIEHLQNEILAQCDPLSLEIDPDICSGIGGHIHIAKITRSLGFQWVNGFEIALPSA